MRIGLKTIFFLALLLAVSGGHFAYTVEGYEFQIEGSTQQPSASPAPSGSASSFLDNFYIWLLGVVGLASLFALVYGGVLYIFSGAIDSTAEAKRWMTNAFFGLLIAGASYLILRTINPELVRKLNIDSIIQDRARR